MEVAAGILQRGKPIETLTLRKSHGSTAGTWEFPGGKQEPDESLRECLFRELNEELGINASIGDYVGVSEYLTSSALIRLHAYLVPQWSGEIVLKDHDASLWLSVGQLLSVDWSPADVPLVEQLIDLQQDPAGR